MDPIQLPLPGMPPAPRRTPKAQTEQGYSDQVDAELVALARANRPTVAWWWGVRKHDGRTGAQCYVCGEWMAYWSHQHPMTVTAKAAVKQHRLTHWRAVANGLRG